MGNRVSHGEQRVSVKEWLVLGLLGIWLTALAPSAALGSEGGYRVILGTGTFWFFLNAWLTYMRVPWHLGRLALSVLFVPAFLLGVLICGVGYAMIADVFTKIGFLVAMFFHAAMVARAAFLGARGQSTRRSRYWAYGSSFLAANLHPILASILYVAPSVATCEKVASQPGVQWLSPLTWLDDTAQANTVLWDERTETLIAPFKNASNRMLHWWDDPDGNFVMVLKYAQDGSPTLHKLKLAKGLLPEDVAVHPENQALWVMSLTIGEHRHRAAVDHFTLSDKKPRKAGSGGGEFGNVFGSPLPESGMVLFGQQQEYAHIDMDGKQTIVGDKVDGSGPLVFDTWYHPVTMRNYLTHLGSDILEYNVDNQQVQRLPIFWAAGEVTGSAKLNRLYHTDVLFDSLNVFDLASRTHRKRLQLDYKPRPITVADDLDLLFIGEWLPGKIHVYRLSTLAYLGMAVESGPYIRGWDVDETNKRLFMGSKCGVGAYTIPEKFLPEISPATTDRVP